MPKGLSHSHRMTGAPSSPLSSPSEGTEHIYSVRRTASQAGGAASIPIARSDKAAGSGANRGGSSDVQGQREERQRGQGQGATSADVLTAPSQ